MKTNELIEEGHNDYLRQKMIKAIADWLSSDGGWVNVEHIDVNDTEQVDLFDDIAKTLEDQTGAVIDELVRRKIEKHKNVFKR